MTIETTTEQVDELSEFEKAFMEASGSDAKADVDGQPNDDASNNEQEVSDESSQATESQDSNPNDVPAGLTVEELQAKVDNLTRERNHFEHSAKANSGRVSAFQKKINDYEARENAKKDEVAPVNPESSGMTDSAWDDFVEEYPDMAQAFDARLKSVTRNFDERIESGRSDELQRIQDVVQPLEQKAHDERIKDQFSMLEYKHPDWNEVASSANFKEWIGEQPEDMQARMNSDDAQSASYLLDVYKAMTGSVPNTQPGVQQNRQDRLQSNVSVKARGAKQSAGIPESYEDAFKFFSK
jgi:hypothetical protein